jgi:hypothetical protein
LTEHALELLAGKRAAPVDVAGLLAGKRAALTIAIKSACRHAPGWAVLEEEDRAELDRMAERSADLVYPQPQHDVLQSTNERVGS